MYKSKIKWLYMAQEIRLYINHTLKEQDEVTIIDKQAHYLINVMRCKAGDFITLFNGMDGEWQAQVTSITKKTVTLSLVNNTKKQSYSPDLWLVFAPVKGKTEIIAEKATELGVRKILPVITKHCVVRNVNMEKISAHVIEAAEQCERLDIPDIEPHNNLQQLLKKWDEKRILLYGNERGGGGALHNVLQNIKVKHPDENNLKLAVLVGPEGGFSTEEITMLNTYKFVVAFSMGSRILKADTAAVAALSCIQSQFGGWEEKPNFTGSY